MTDKTVEDRGGGEVAMPSPGPVKISYTSMHSGRMCTACLLPISPSMHCAGGCLLLEGYTPLVLGEGGGVCLWSGGCVSQHAMEQTPPCGHNS